MPFASHPADQKHSSQPATPLGITRRQFQSLAVVGAAGFAMPNARAATETKTGDSDWIDAHVHVWTPDTERYPLAPGFTTADMQPASFTPEELFARCRPHGVRRIVLIQMNFYGFDNSYMLDVIADAPQSFAGVGIVDSQATDVADKIEDLSKRGVRGLRIHPGPGEAAAWTEDRGMAIVWRTAGRLGLAICPLINPSDLPHVDAMCARFPGVRVVVDHCARIGMDGRIEPDQLDALCRLARFPETYVKTSAFYALGKKQPPYADLVPMIRRLVDCYGPQRLMWASDCPFQVQDQHSYAASIGLIRDSLDFLSDTERQAMLRRTAERVFFAPSEGSLDAGP